MAREGVAFFDGRYMSLGEARISVLDPAVTKSDIGFDAVSVINRLFFRLDDHVDRFQNSCKKVRISPPVARDKIKHICAECVYRSGFDDAVVFFCGTRGLYRDSVAFGDPRDCENGFYAYAVPYYSVVPRDRIETGVHLWIVETRRAPNEAIDQTAKNFNRMDLTKGTFEALDHGADAAVLLSTRGYLSEGAGFNIWIIRGNTLLTPGENLLEGITRRTVFDLAREMGIEAKAANLTPSDLVEAQEALLSTTAGAIISVTRVNDLPLGNGAPGLLTGNLRNRYWQKRRSGWLGTSVDSLLI
jgi:branched-chain amino acid aminotransferase